MGRVAVITDIHGNLAALKAALGRIDELGIVEIYCGGDLVGYGPYPNEVCDLIEDRGIPTIYGNYDYAIGRDLEDCGCAYRGPHDQALGESSIAWTLEHTDARSKAFMRDLPFDLRFELGGKRVRLVHGSPRKVNEYLSRTSRSARSSGSRDWPRLRPHPPAMDPRVRRVLFVDCGSVGKPKDGDPRAAFAVLDGSGGQVKASLERVGYDAEAVASEVAEAGLLAQCGEKLLQAA